MATTILPKGEKMQVRLLRSMHIKGEFIAAGTVVEVDRQDGRSMIYHERAVPFVAQPEAVQADPVTPPEPATPAADPAPAAEITAVELPAVADSVPVTEPAKVSRPRTRKHRADATVADVGNPVSPAAEIDNPGSSV